jgi:hypothetical protein
VGEQRHAGVHAHAQLVQARGQHTDRRATDLAHRPCDHVDGADDADAGELVQVDVGPATMKKIR